MDERAAKVMFKILGKFNPVEKVKKVMVTYSDLQNKLKVKKS